MPKAQLFWQRVEDNVFHLPTAKGLPQFVFGVFQDLLLFLREIFPSAVDVKIQHRHRRLIRCAFTSFAPFGRTFQRQRNAMRLLPFEDIRLEIECVVALRYLGRPAAIATFNDFFRTFAINSWFALC
jgi:hypothetical protein